jgi:hypothetical protein
VATSSISTPSAQPWSWIVGGGLLARALDITYAWAFWSVKAGVSAQRIFQVARRWPLLWRAAVACGLLYGLLLYAIMNFIVVPLSAACGGGPKDPLWVAMSVGVHPLFIGLPIALFTRRAIGAQP